MLQIPELDLTTPGSRPLHLVALSWRDSAHPEAGGAELYLEQVLERLAADGHRVTVLTARAAGAPAREQRRGLDLHRAGGRLTVYLRALLTLLGRRLGPVDVVIDVQNGVPFWARLVTRRPVVVLCHHVHREQWHIAFGDSLAGRVLGHLGWFLESRVAPVLLRGCRYLTVSEVTRTELVELGVRAADVSVVHNGTPAPLDSPVGRGAVPEVVVLGRLVPHKRVEHAVRAVAALAPLLPELRLTVVGQGWWEPQLRAEIARLGLQDRVELTGFVTEETKSMLLARAWVQATPSVKEGWGLSVVEAGSHGCPSVAYRSAGGVAESVVDGVTGLLVDDDEAAFTAALGALLLDQDRRDELGTAAALHADRFSWDATTDGVATVLAEVTGRVVHRAPVLRTVDLREPAADHVPAAAVPAPRTSTDGVAATLRAG